MMRIQSFSVAVLFCLVLSVLSPGCVHRRAKELNIQYHNNRAFVFGTLQILRNKEDRTKDATVVFSNGRRVELQKDGFVAIPTDPHDLLKIEKIILKSARLEYSLPKLFIKAGPATSKTYFGHIFLNIELIPVKRNIPNETWTWFVGNRWKKAWAHWNQNFGPDSRRFYYKLASEAGQERPVTRSIATDRDEVVLGL